MNFGWKMVVGLYFDFSKVVGKNMAHKLHIKHKRC